MYTITDVNAGLTATVEADDVAETLRGWFADCLDEGEPLSIGRVIDSLQARMLRGEYYGADAEYLGVDVVLDVN